jgi:hypothetical protein
MFATPLSKDIDWLDLKINMQLFVAYKKHVTLTKKIGFG